MYEDKDDIAPGQVVVKRKRNSRRIKTQKSELPEPRGSDQAQAMRQANAGLYKALDGLRTVEV